MTHERVVDTHRAGALHKALLTRPDIINGITIPALCEFLEPTGKQTKDIPKGESYAGLCSIDVIYEHIVGHLTSFPDLFSSRTMTVVEQVSSTAYEQATYHILEVKAATKH